jgi:mono/diheme cytochrome c family protein/nitrite reductase/ring-hydroxylating ferredoxin subunit
MRQKDYIRTFLYKPGKEIPGAIMPWVRMTSAEEERILLSLQERGENGHLYRMRPKHLYMALCQRCHAAQGDGLGTIQPNLANFPRAFWKNQEFFRRIPDERIVKSIENGIPGTSMPPYGELLGHEGVDSLIHLIFREFIRIKRNEKRSDLTVPPRPAEMLPRDNTEKDFRKHCSSCHGVAGNGKGPEYLKYLPRPRDLTNRPYFKSIRDDRITLAISDGVAGTGMGPFRDKISPESIWSLVNKIGNFQEPMENHGIKLIGRIFQGALGWAWGFRDTLAWIFDDLWSAAGRFSSARWIRWRRQPVAAGERCSFPEYRIAIFRWVENRAISLECTHLGCLLNTVDRGFFCPCHGSDFGPLGEVYSGPAKDPLPWHDVVHREGRIWVHLGKKLDRPKWLALEGHDPARVKEG